DHAPPEDLGPSANQDAVLKNRSTRNAPAESQCHLLHERAVCPDDRTRMHDNPVGMREPESWSYRRSERNVSSGDHRPPAFGEREASGEGNDPLVLVVAVVRPDEGVTRQEGLHAT